MLYEKIRRRKEYREKKHKTGEHGVLKIDAPNMKKAKEGRTIADLKYYAMNL